jgi:hypothetical protein
MKISTFLVLICFFTTSLLAQPTALTYPISGGQQAQGGSNGPWANPIFMNATDGQEATSSTFLTVNAKSDRLVAFRFGFAIPPTATILGIEVQINRGISDIDPSSNVVDEEITLLKAGVSQPTNKANVLLPWPVGATTVEVYGGPTDLWGNTWTPAQVNAIAFGVGIVARRFQLTGGNRFARVEDVRVRVYWSNSLPIVLKSFDVRKVNVSTSQISWVTEQEKNVRNYEVERSANGINFSTIAQVTPKSPNSNSDISYAVLDSKPLPGNNFYRLKQTDIDGKFEVFAIKSVTFDNSEAFFKINTANNRLKLTSANKKGLYSVLIRDTQGRLLQQETLNLEAAVNESYINLKPSVKGVVFVTISGSAELKSFRLFVE